MNQPPVPGEDTEFEFLGDITDYWSYTQVRDWVLHIPGVTPTAALLYLMLRSMITEKRPGGLRRMSIDQICYLLTPYGGKPVGESTVRNSLALLAKLGLVTNPDRERIVTSSGKGGIQNTLRRYKVSDLPPDSFVGWRNTWDKLNAYDLHWRTQPVVPPTHVRTDNGVRSISSARTDLQELPVVKETAGQIDRWISSNTGSKSSAPRSKTSTTRSASSDGEAPTCTDVASKETPQRSSSLSTGPVDPSTPDVPAIPPGKREDSAPQEPQDQPDLPTVPEASPAVAQLLACWHHARLTAGVGRHFKGQEADQEFGSSAAALVAAGRSLPWLLDLAAWMGTAKPAWANLGGATTAQQMGAPREPVPLPQQRILSRCPDCDPNAPVPTHYKDPQQGLGPYRCPMSVPVPVHA